MSFFNVATVRMYTLTTQCCVILSYPEAFSFPTDIITFTTSSFVAGWVFTLSTISQMCHQFCLLQTVFACATDSLLSVTLVKVLFCTLI